MPPPSTPTYSSLSDVQTATSSPFGFATASSRTDAGTSDVTGGGMHDPQTIIDALPEGWEHGTSYTLSNSKKVIVLASTGSDMSETIGSYINNNDIIVFDGTNGDFIFKNFVTLQNLSAKTILGINNATLKTEWYATADDIAALESAGVKSMSTSGNGGTLSNGTVVNEEAEYNTRRIMIERYSDSSEWWRKSGIFYIKGCSNFIIRNLNFQGPGAMDLGGSDLVSIIDGCTHMWIDHCDFADGQDGNMDITNASDFITASWNKFHYTSRSYMHQNTNLVGSGETTTNDTNDGGKLNITFAYNNWGDGCNQRMPMARYGKIHLLNNYYSCAGAGATVNPRKNSEFLIDANCWASDVNKVFTQTDATAYTWNSNNICSVTAPTSTANTVTVPYDYSSLILDPESLATAIPENAGATMTVNMPTAPLSDNFVCDFTTADYTVKSGALPDGATVTKSAFNGSQHGYQDAVVTFKVTKPSIITVNGCNYGNRLNLKDGDNVIASYNAKKLGCNGKAMFLYEGTGETTLTVDAHYLTYLSLEPVTQEMIPATVSGTAYDITVTNGDQLRYALAKANGTSRYKIFLKNGDYDLGSRFGTYVKDNVTLVGESRNGVTIHNAPVHEGIWYSSTLMTGSNVVMQNLSVQCNATKGSSVGFDQYSTANDERGTALYDAGTGNKYQNIRLLSRQDTYYSTNAANSIFNDCEIHGTVDFICGSGNAWFENCDLLIESAGNAYITAARKKANSSDNDYTYTGYIFNGCTVDNATGADMAGKYYLGRGWGNDAIVKFYNTTFTIEPNTDIWHSPMSSVSDASTLTQINETTAATETPGTTITLPSAPATVTITGNILTWTEVSGASGYAIYRGTALVTTVGSGVTEYNISSTSPAKALAMRKTGASSSDSYSVASISSEGVIGESKEAEVVKTEETIYSWESPEGTVSEKGGTIAYVNGEEGKDFVNYTQTPYYTICINGKKANLDDATASANAGHMVITLTEGLKEGDKITMTGFRNKNAEGKKASVYMKLENGTEFAGVEGGMYWTNIYSDDTKDDYDSDGNTPNSYTWTVPAAEEGSKTITLTRYDGGTNLFITKIEIVRETIATKSPTNLTICSGKETLAMTVGDKDYALTAGTDYTTSSTGAITYESSNTAVATVSNAGIISAVAEGTATITISQAADDNYQAGEKTISVTVSAATGGTTIKTVVDNVTTWDFSKVTEAMCSQLSNGNWIEKTDDGDNPNKSYSSNASGGDESPAFLGGLTINTCGSDKSRIYYNPAKGYCFNGGSAYIKIPVTEGQTLKVYSAQTIVSGTSGVTFASNDGIYKAVIPTGVSSVTIKRSSGATYVTKIELVSPVVVHRTFTDFKIDFQTNPRTVTLPEDGNLPDGVVISGTSYNGAQHGIMNGTITVPVDGPVNFTIGSCQYGKHTITVTDADNNTLATIDNNNGCDNANQKTKFVTWVYNSETPTTLTFSINGYLPFFYATACAYIPQVTVTYYNTDGTTVVGKETVDGNSKLSYKYSAADVAIPDGSVFRGWFNKPYATNYTGEKVAEETPLIEDCSLYAIATPKEEANVGNSYTFNFEKKNFYVEDHECIDITDGKYHNADHGWEFKANGTIKIPTTEYTRVTVGLCQYPEPKGEVSESNIITVTSSNKAGTIFPSSAVVPSKSVDEKDETKNKSVIEYVGPATDLTLTFGSSAYLHSIKVEYLKLPELTLTNQITSAAKTELDHEVPANAGTLSKTRTGYNISSGYKPGETVTITAKAGYGYKLTGFVCESGEGKGSLSGQTIAEDGKSGTVTFTVGTLSGAVTAQYERLELGGKIRLESANSEWGDVNFEEEDIHANFYTKGTGYVESYFVLGDEITAITDATDGYVFDQWMDATDQFLSSSDSYKISITAASQTYKAAFFKGGFTGKVIFDITNAILLDKNGSVTTSPFDITADKMTNAGITYINTQPDNIETTSFSIPRYHTLFKSGYTLVKWVNKANTAYEYTLGKNYAFRSENEQVTLVPVLQENPTTQFNRLNEPTMEYCFGTGKGIRAQNVNLGNNFKGYWTAQVYVEAIDQGVEYDHYRDVALYVNTGSKGFVRNGDLDEWASFGQGTEFYIASCADTKVEICSYAPISTTTFGGDPFVLDEAKSDIANHQYVYYCITQSTEQRVPIIIGDDYSYYKYIKVYSQKASRVNLHIAVDDEAKGEIDMTEAVNKDVADHTKYLVDGGYSFLQGNSVKVTFERKFGFEFDKIIDPDKIVNGEPLAVLKMRDDGKVDMVRMGNASTVETVDPNADGNSWGAASSLATHVFYFKKIEPTAAEKETNPDARTKYEIMFNITTHRNLQICFKEKPTYYVTYNAGQYATGAAPAAQWLEDGDKFTVPQNHTLYYEGNTLKYWVDSKYDYSKTKEQNVTAGCTIYNIGTPTVLNKNWGTAASPDYNLRLFPVFEKNTFTLLDDVVDNKTATWEFTQPAGAPVINFERTAGILVSQLHTDDDWIDLKIDLDASDKTIGGTRVNGKFNNDSKEYPNRCQINNNSTLTFPTTTNCSVTLTASQKVANVTIAGASVGTGQSETVTYEGGEASQDVKFLENGYYTRFTVTYQKQSVTAKPALTSVKYGTNELDLTTLIANHQLDGVGATVNATTEAMATVSATANNGGVVTVTQPTVTNPQSTITLKTAKGMLVDTYTINFTPQLPANAGAIEFLGFEINGVTYTDKNPTVTNMPVSGTIKLKFNRTMEEFTMPSGAGLAANYTAERGKELVFKYWNLSVAQSQFAAPSGTFKDIYGNTYNEALTLHLEFTTTPIEINHKTFDFVVGKDGDANAAIAAANAATGTDRYYVFIPDGDYLLTGNEEITNSQNNCDQNGQHSKDGQTFNNGQTLISRANVSLIGQSQNGVLLHNNPIVEGIGYTGTIHTGKYATDFYAEEMTLNNDFDYWKSYKAQSGTQAARAVAFYDQGNRSIMKNVTIKSYQDTYYSSNASSDYRGYFENCQLWGVVDWACGAGDIWWEKCDIVIRDRDGNNFAAPHTELGQQWGYVLNECNIYPEPGVELKDLNGKDWTLARPWGDSGSQSPACTFLNTNLSILPRDAGWGNMGASMVLRFHEYNTMLNGNKISLGTRSLVASNPSAGSDDCILTDAQAANYTLANVMGGSDSFNPQLYTQQIDAKSGAAADKDANNSTEWNDGIEIDDEVLQWNTKNEALCYFIFYKANESDTQWTYVTNITQATDDETITSYNLSGNNYKPGWYCVRAANQRGGLGAATMAVEYKKAETYTLNLNKAKAEMDKTNMTDQGWSTICLPYNAKVPATKSNGDVPSVFKVYAAKSIKDNTITLKAVKYLTANKGYVVYGEPGDYDFTQSSHTSEETDGVTTLLNGNPNLPKEDEDMTLNASYYSCYTLAYKPTISGIGFYKYTGAKLACNRAWLDVATFTKYNESDEDENTIIQTAGAKGIRFVFEDGEDDPLGIENVTIDRIDDRIFDLSGCRVVTPVKGRVYIINGRKVLWRR